MKLFIEDLQSRKNNFKFRGNYTFRILNETKSKDSKATPCSEYKMAAFLPQSSDISLDISYLEKDLYLDEPLIASTKASNESFGFVLESHIATSAPQTQPTQIVKKKSKYIKLNFRNLKQKKNHYNIGRWTEDEHRRFIEAIMKYGNEWKSVQKHIKTRSSTQSRSHSQKFFMKIKNYDIFDFKNRKPCISSLNDLAQSLNEKERKNMLELLISYEYHDLPERKTCEDKLLSKKRGHDSPSRFDFTLENDNINMSVNNSGMNSNLTTSNLSYSVQTSCNTPEKEEVNEDKKDEFKDHFFNAFLNSRLRRHSFEDNVLVLYADAILIDKNRKKSNHIIKPQEDSESSIGDTFIEFDHGFIMV